MSDMKLSEAIRLGAMMKPQAIGSMHSGGHTCALGAALDAIGFDFGLCATYGTLGAKWPLVESIVAVPRAADDHFIGDRAPMWRVIETLNDLCHWSREQIADWVETVERRAEAESARTETETAAPSVRLVPPKS